MDATVRFWHGVLDARLVTTLATPAFRHYFFEVAPGNTVAFFEYHDVDLDVYAKPAGVPYRQASQFDHLSLALADEEALHRLQARLKEHGRAVADPYRWLEDPSSEETASWSLAQDELCR